MSNCELHSIPSFLSALSPSPNKSADSTLRSASKRPSLDPICSEPNKKKRGRRPVPITVDINESLSDNSSISENVENSEKQKIVKFGNKKVIYGSEEYADKRKKNQEAVKSARQKLDRIKKENDEKLKSITEENDNLLSQKDNYISKIILLKESILKVQANPPEEIRQILEDFEENYLKYCNYG